MRDNILLFEGYAKHYSDLEFDNDARILMLHRNMLASANLLNQYSKNVPNPDPLWVVFSKNTGIIVFT